MLTEIVVTTESRLQELIDRAMGNSLNRFLSDLPTSSEKEQRFGDELTARIKLGGGKKPISKSTLYALRDDGHISAHHPSPGRTLYDLQQIDQYIEKQKSR